MELQKLLPQLHQMQSFYASGATRGYAFRKQQLMQLKNALFRHEAALHAALYEDLKKSAEESWVTETGFLLSEINHAIKNVHKWMKPQKVATNLLNLPSRSYIYKEPLGVVLIVGLWNYPLQLLFAPLVGAIAAGNCVVLKPSEFAKATATVMEQIINEVFPKEYIMMVQGEGAEVIPAMMHNFRFDHVFYTG